MPWWLSTAIQLAIRLGIPELEKHLSPALVNVIQQVIDYVKVAPDKSVAVKSVGYHMDCLVGAPPNIKPE